MAMAMAAKHTSLFLHATWRSASTYIWETFRSFDAYYAYYEPFHEHLATADDEFTSDYSISSGLRHPKLSNPYFLEYKPLLTTQGVAGYRDSFSVKNYFCNQDELLRDQKEYIARLLFEADIRDRMAVLGFCRSSGRVEWMKRQFPDALHVLVVRNWIQQWTSSLDQHMHNDNPYFLVMPLACLAAAEHDILAMAVRDKLGVPRIDTFTFEQCYLHAKDIALAAPIERLFSCFVAFQLLSFIRARPYADIVLDVNMLASDRRYAEQVVAYLGGHLPVVPDFNDAAESDLEQLDVPFSMEEVVRDVVQLFDTVGKSLSESSVVLQSGDRTPAWSEAVKRLSGYKQQSDQDS